MVAIHPLVKTGGLLAINFIKYSKKKLLLEIIKRKEIWEKELSLLLKSVPKFSLVVSDIKKYLE